MKPFELKEKIEALSDGTIASVTDLTGTEDHYEVKVISPVFTSKSTMERQRMVMKTVRSEIDSGEVHALSMKLYAPEELA